MRCVRGQDSLNRILLIFLCFPSSTIAGYECYESFDEFLPAFENNKAVQIDNTIFPLKYTFVDGGAYPEPKVINSELSSKKIEERKNPIYPYPKDQKKVPLLKEISEPSPGKMRIRLYKPDTDYVLRYQFELIGTCWKLTEYNNDSL